MTNQQSITVSEINRLDDVDCDIVNADYADYKIIFDEERPTMTTTGLLKIPAGSYLLKDTDDDGCLVAKLITVDKKYQLNVDAGMFVFCDWLDLDDRDCWPTITEII